MEIMLRIDNYQSPAKHNFGDWWCDCGFSFRFGNTINYSVEHVFFWNEGLTSNYLTITLDRDDIISFRDYLNSCRTE